ncbi:MAG: hypothetical protein ABIQ74_06230 [Chitinophagales bacterium]
MRKTILLLAALAGIVLVTTSSVTDMNGLCDSPVVGGHTGAPGSPDCTYCHVMRNPLATQRPQPFCKK